MSLETLSDALLEQAISHLGAEPKDIEKILPCTPYQCEVMECASNNARLAFGSMVYSISESVDAELLAAAWKNVVRICPVLRTRMLTTGPGKHYQVLLSNPVAWSYNSSQKTADVIEKEIAASLETGQCNRFAVLEKPGTNQRFLVWTFSHALVDSALRETILGKVDTLYDGGCDYDWPGMEASTRPPTEEPESVQAFWKQHFDATDAAVFPILPRSTKMAYPTAKTKHHVLSLNSALSVRSNIILCQAALTALLAQYTNAAEVVFGGFTERALLLEKHEQSSESPKTAVLPYRASYDPFQSGSDLMQSLVSRERATRYFQNTHHKTICLAGESAAAACQFQTVLAFTPSDNVQVSASRLHQVVVQADSFVPCNGRALVIECQIGQDSAELAARFDPDVIDHDQSMRFVQQLGYVIQQLQSPAVDLPFCEIHFVTKEDQAAIDRWISEPPRTTEVCIHNLVTDQAIARPHASAVSAWDGEWTFAELDHQSSRLSGHIQALGLGLGQAVPLCFEKSKWTVVAILAVLKAGGAFTLVEPSTPKARIAKICSQTSAALALVSKRNYDLLSDAVSRLLIVDNDLLWSLPHDTQAFTSTAKPQDLAYIIFTSGSTGEPKGCMIEHRGFASSAVEYAPAFQITNATRALQFASYAFSACMVEILATLMVGGCVCIPSEEDRMNNITAFINQARVDWALFSPSMACTIEPQSVPALKTLVVGGESLSVEVRDIWASHVELFCAYGQSESSTLCGISALHPHSSEVSNLGRAVGARFWITNPNNPDRLVPIGCVGELVVESPGIARGYTTTSAQGTSPFLDQPQWFSGRPAGDFVKFFRTGDLVCLRSDHTLVILGRRDCQIQIRGQRVEPSEVESYLRLQLPSHTTPLVEGVPGASKSANIVLVAFLIGPMKDETNMETSSASIDPNGQIIDQIAANSISLKLKDHLPLHSIPVFYVRLEQLPRTASGKADRKRLRKLGKELLAHRSSTSVSDESALGPASELEKKLRQMWFSSLDLDPNDANPDADFFDLGGDSITAIWMVNMAQAAGLQLNVGKILQNPKLSSLAKMVTQEACPDDAVL